MAVRAKTGGQGRIRGTKAGAQQGIGSSPSYPAADPLGFLLLENNTDKLLMENGSDFLLMEV